MLTNAKCITETRYRENKQQNQQHSKHQAYKGIVWIKQDPTIKTKGKACMQEIKRCEVITPFNEQLIKLNCTFNLMNNSLNSTVHLV